MISLDANTLVLLDFGDGDRDREENFWKFHFNGVRGIEWLNGEWKSQSCFGVSSHVFALRNLHNVPEWKFS
jgi:hypothetical protein